MKLSVTVILAALQLAAAVPTLLTPPDNLAISTSSFVGSAIEDQWIVVLNDDISTSAVEEHEVWAAHVNDNRLTRRHDRSLGLGRKFKFGKKWRGYSGRFVKETIDEIRKRPEVAYVEQDSIMSIYGLTTQENAPWGLSRISHRNNNIVEGGNPNPTTSTDSDIKTVIPVNSTLSVPPAPTTTVPVTTDLPPATPATTILPTPTGHTAGRPNTWNSKGSFVERFRGH